MPAGTTKPYHLDLPSNIDDGLITSNNANGLWLLQAMPGIYARALMNMCSFISFHESEHALNRYTLED